MDIPAQSPSSTSETYRLPLWWPQEMVVVPTAPREDRDAVIRRAVKWMQAGSHRQPPGTELDMSPFADMRNSVGGP